MIRRIDHLGIAVSRHDEAGAFYAGVLGLPRHHVEEIASQRVRTAFHPCAGVDFELLESTSPDGPVAKFLEKRGEGFHHVAFEVDDVRAELSRLAAAGIRLIDQDPRAGAHGTQIAFLHPKSTHGLLIELVQRPKKG